MDARQEAREGGQVTISGERSNFIGRRSGARWLPLENGRAHLVLEGKPSRVFCFLFFVFSITWTILKDFVDFFYNIVSVSCFGFLAMRYVGS